MYKDVDDTRNFIGGRCPNNCSYCYVESLKRFPVIKKKYSGKLRLIKNEFKKPLGKGKFIFIGSCNDMFADNIPATWIIKILEYCSKYDNTYLFQTKNPERFFEFLNKFPKKTIFGTTIETDKSGLSMAYSNAPVPLDRIAVMCDLQKQKKQIMISLEPLMEFNLNVITASIELIKPTYISIGADSKNHNLPEPSPEKVKALIKELRKITKVIEKDNLKRLTNGISKTNL